MKSPIVLEAYNNLQKNLKTRQAYLTNSSKKGWHTYAKLIPMHIKKIFTKKNLWQKDPVPSFGKRWDIYAKWTLKHIEEFLTVKQAIDFAQTAHGFELRETQDLFKAIHKWENKVKSEFPHYTHFFNYFSEPSYISNSTIIDYNGRAMSTMLCHLIRFHFAVISYCGLPKTICEIGGGYGAPARVWMSSPLVLPETYIIIDVAESLFFSECYLRQEYLNHPDIQIVNLGNPESVESIHNKKRLIVLCPTEKIAMLSRFNIDLIINTLSMQEMSEEWIDYYMEWLDSTKAKHFYSFNALLTPINKMHEVSNTFSPRPSKQWRPRIVGFPYADGPAAEIIYDRVELKNPNNDDLQFLNTLWKLPDNPNKYAMIVSWLYYLQNIEEIKKFVTNYTEYFSYTPKELSYFCDQILEHSNDITIVKTKKEIDILRKQGNEGAVHEFINIEDLD